MQVQQPNFLLEEKMIFGVKYSVVKKITSTKGWWRNPTGMEMKGS